MCGSVCSAHPAQCRQEAQAAGECSGLRLQWGKTVGGAAWLVVAASTVGGVEAPGVKRDETPSYEAEPAPSTCRSPPPPVGDTQDHKTFLLFITNPQSILTLSMYINYSACAKP